MNNLLFLIGILFLSNGNISLLDYKDKFKNESGSKSKKTRERGKKMPNDGKNIFKFNVNDINKGMNLMELSEEDIEMGMELLTRTKKYMSREERKIVIKIESILDLVSGIKKLNSVDTSDIDEETDFFRNMDDEDKKNMMIKEILDVFPSKRKDSVKKALDMKKKIDVFAELFLPDDFGEGGFSLSSLADFGNLGSMSNLKMLGSLLRSESGNIVANSKSKSGRRSSDGNKMDVGYNQSNYKGNRDYYDDFEQDEYSDEDNFYDDNYYDNDFYDREYEDHRSFKRSENIDYNKSHDRFECFDDEDEDEFEFKEDDYKYEYDDFNYND